MRAALSVLGVWVLVASAPASAQPASDAVWGRDRAGEPRPEAAVALLCTDRPNACVHLCGEGMRGVDAKRALRVLEDTFAAFAALGLPSLPGDGALGSAGPAASFDLYLDARATRGRAAVGPADPTAATDVAAPFAIAPLPAAGCGFEHEVARALGAAVALGIDAAQSDLVADMYGAYLASLVAPCTGFELPAVAARAFAPEAGLFGPEPDPLFFAYLASGYGRGDPVSVPTALMATAAQRARPGAASYRDEPDLFDSLRESLRTRASNLDDLIIDFAVARAFEGSRSDGVHLTGSERFGDFARVRFDWVVPFASLPRRLGPRDALRASGASYLWLDVSNATPEDHLKAYFEWDEGQVYRWALVRVDAAGRELGRIVAPGVYGQDFAHLSMADFQGAAGILIVGAHVGSDDRARPLDPDELSEPGAGYLATLYVDEAK